jgi:hypothetical protein
VDNHCQKCGEQSNILQIFRWEAAFQRTQRHVHGNTERSVGRPEGEYTDRTKWNSEQNLIGIND